MAPWRTLLPSFFKQLSVASPNICSTSPCPSLCSPASTGYGRRSSRTRSFSSGRPKGHFRLHASKGVPGCELRQQWQIEASLPPSQSCLGLPGRCHPSSLGVPDARGSLFGSIACRDMQGAPCSIRKSLAGHRHVPTEPRKETQGALHCQPGLCSCSGL